MIKDGKNILLRIFEIIYFRNFFIILFNKTDQEVLKLNFFKNSSLRLRLMLAFTITTLLPCIVIVITSFFNSENQIRSEQHLSAQNSLDLVNEDIASLVTEKSEQIEFFSQEIENAMYDAPSDKLFPLLDTYLALNKDILIAYVGTEDGVMLRRPYFDYDSSYDPRTREWYEAAMNAPGETFVSDPYISASTGELVITIARQLEDSTGVVGIDLSIQTIADIANNISVGESGYFSVIAKDNEMTSNIDKDAAGDQALLDYLQQQNGLTNVVTTNDLTNWQIVATIVNKDAMSAAFSTVKKNIITIVICLMINGIIVVLLISSIVTPLHHLNDSSKLISEGDLTTRLDVSSKDEVGQLGHSFNAMRDNLRELISQVNNSSVVVNQAANQLFESTTQSIHATTESAIALQKVAENNEQQLLNNEVVHSTLQSVVETSTEITERSKNTAQITNVAIDHAHEGNIAVLQTVKQMTAIHTAVSQSDLKIQTLTEQIANIDTIVDVINGIANQTNLLALNASIEAARAGEQGKGFAVVANEVKSLAESSQQATEQIAKLIQSIQMEAQQLVHIMNETKRNVSDGIEITEQSAQKFDQIFVQLKEVMPQMDYIVAKANDMHNSVLNTETISHETMVHARENAAASEEVAAASEEIHASMEDMNYSANNLQEMATNLQQLVKKFHI